MLALLSPVVANALTITTWELKPEDIDIPAIMVQSYGQKIHVAVHTQTFVRGGHFACFRNFSDSTVTAHYTMTVRGMGQSRTVEGDLTLTRRSAMCAGEERPYFPWLSPTAGIYGYDVITTGRLRNQSKTATAKGTVYVGQ